MLNKLTDMLGRYMAAYPAFRIKPVGSEGSQAREEQERLMKLEEEAAALLKAVDSRWHGIPNADAVKQAEERVDLEARAARADETVVGKGWYASLPTPPQAKEAENV